MNARLLFIIGTIHWFLFASGHSIIVDIDFVLGMHSPLGPKVLPDGDLVRETLISNTWDFGWLGVANPHRALSGFSIWLGVSAFFFGLINAVIGLSRKLPRELFYRLTQKTLPAIPGSYLRLSAGKQNIAHFHVGWSKKSNAPPDNTSISGDGEVF